MALVTESPPPSSSLCLSSLTNNSQSTATCFSAWGFGRDSSVSQLASLGKWVRIGSSIRVRLLRLREDVLKPSVNEHFFRQREYCDSGEIFSSRWVGRPRLTPENGQPDFTSGKGLLKVRGYVYSIRVIYTVAGYGIG